MKLIIWIVISIVLLTGIGLGVAFFVMRGAKDAAGSGTPVRVETATTGDLVETISAPGIIEAKSKVSISARVAARIIEIPFKEGEKVTKGNPTANPPIPPSVLVKLDSTDLQAQLDSATARYSAQEAQLGVSTAAVASQKSQLESTQVQLTDAQRDLRRQKELLTSKDVSESIADAAQAKVDQLKASLAAAQYSLEGATQNLNVLKFQLQAAKADIARAKDNLSYTTITSPIDGVVTRVNSQAGELVVIGTMNNAGTVIMEVADLSRMILKARVDESSIALVKVGQKAVVRIPAYKDKEFAGSVTTVALAETVETGAGGARYFKAEVLLDTKGQQIISGLNADVEIETASFKNVITVPSQAVLGRPLDGLPVGVRNAPEVEPNKTIQTVVYRLIEGKAVVTPVTVGTSDIQRTMIKSGIKAGDVVVTGPFKVLDTLANDQAIKGEVSVPTTIPSPTTVPSTTTSPS